MGTSDYGCYYITKGQGLSQRCCVQSTLMHCMCRIKTLPENPMKGLFCPLEPIWPDVKLLYIKSRASKTRQNQIPDALIDQK